MTPNIWAILPDAIGQIRSRWSTGERHTPLTSADIRSQIGDTAIIAVCGVLTRDDTKPETVSPDVVAEAVRRAVADDTVSRIVLSVDSPGGSAAGVSEFADVIFQSRGKKPIIAHGTGHVCSAAYEVASQCDAIYCEPTTLIGSIGTITSLVDSSRAFEAMGLEEVVATTAHHKTIGVPGVPIDAEHRTHLQEMVESFNHLFLEAVRRGRSFSQLQLNAVSDGRVFIASEAKIRKLIDGVATFDDVLQQTSFSKKGNKMTTTATLADLRAAVPGADSDFILEAAEKGLSIEAARFAWDQRKKAAAEAAKTTPRQHANLGVNPARQSANDGMPQDALSFADLVAEHRKSNPNVTHRDAVTAVARRHPQAHQEFLASANRRNRGAETLLKDRFQ